MNERKEEFEDRNEKLKDVAVLNDEDLTLGLPTRLLYAGAGLSVILAFLLPIVIGVLFGFVYFSSMYAIHKDDPRALQLWINTIVRPNYVSAGIRRRRSVRLL
jgi:hypothetical protein